VLWCCGGVWSWMMVSTRAFKHCQKRETTQCVCLLAHCVRCVSESVVARDYLQSEALALITSTLECFKDIVAG
jgi:hypothetical protein